MAQHRQHVRQSVPRQELVASKRLFGHREKGRNGKALPKRRRQNGGTRSQRGKVWLGAWMPSMPGTEERGQFFPSTGTNGKSTQQKSLPKPQVIRPDTLNMTKTKQQWEQEMERLNEKYKLDTFSDSELNSESHEDEGYQYQHGYKMLI